MIRIEVRRAARVELKSAQDWYEQQRSGLGAKFSSEVRQAFASIREAPTRKPIVKGEIRRAGVRRFPYAIYYFVRAGRVDVLAVLHVRRRPLQWRR